MKVYYAHTVGIYGTPQEQRDVETLEGFGFEVLNPSTPEYQQAYKDHGMDFFVKLAKGCDALAFRGLPDGRIPAGVHKEILAAIENGQPVIELPNAILGRGMSVELTREYLKDCGER